LDDQTGSFQPKDNWASGERYEPYVGRWSRLVARKFLAWLDLPPGGRWLDVGCGTGALAESILEVYAPGAVKGIDQAEGFIAFARRKITDPRANFQTGDAQDLPVATASYDAVVSGLAINFIPQPEKAIAEMARAATPGGRVAVYIWDYAGRMQFMRHFWNAVAALYPEHAGLDEGTRFPLCNPGSLAELLSGAGLKQVEAAPIDIWTEFKDFDDYWAPFLGGQGSAPSYLLSLNETQQAALRERIRAGLPFAVDGSLPLMARAWAVRSIKAGEPIC
jgi:SAM-dependent methyltransferase